MEGPRVSLAPPSPALVCFPDFSFPAHSFPEPLLELPPPQRVRCPSWSSPGCFITLLNFIILLRDCQSLYVNNIHLFLIFPFKMQRTTQQKATGKYRWLFWFDYILFLCGVSCVHSFCVRHRHGVPVPASEPTLLLLQNFPHDAA